MLNLLSNSLKFTPSGGKIKIKVNLVSKLDELTFKDHKFNSLMEDKPGHQWLEISVNDTGIGIKSSERKGLFKMFGFLESTKELNTRGIGLGLAISKMIVH